MNINLQFFFVSLVMTLVIALIFVVNAVLAKKIAAKVRHVMWVVIMLGLIIPFRPMIGSGVIDVPDFTATPMEVVEPPLLENGSIGTAETPVIVSNGSNESVVAANGQISIQTIAFSIWLLVAIGIMGYQIFQYIRFQQAIKRWGEVEEDELTLKLFEQVKHEINLGSSKVRLVVCGFISTSMLTGFLKPVILLPERNYDDGELELIFRHELIHYRRKDLWIKLLSVVAIAIHWFNPLVYLMNISLQTEGEAACDQEVLEMSKLKNRQFYAEVIIGMIGGKKSGMTTFATNFYGGKKGIKKRLEEVMSKTSPHKSISYVFLALVLMLTVMSGSVFAMPISTNMDQDQLESSLENNDEFFEFAIAIVGGGTIVEYDQPSNELLLVHVAYDDDIYLVEIDTINHQIIGIAIWHENSDHVTNDREPITDEWSTSSNTDLSQEEAPPSEISSEQAVEIAMGVAPGRLVEVSRDWENGRPAWWIEIRHNGMVHEFYIDMYSGAILQHESEIDD